ncbi:MAG: aminodeoxychorismate synthase component I [Chloroflexi bacterium]|nr:aminodeoxychorismate synthase component I [Chloroflexota bacterium]
MITTRLLPLVEELDSNRSASRTFDILKEENPCFFLDSGMDHQKQGRFSFVGCCPFLVLKSSGSDTVLTQNAGVEHIRGNPFDVLDQLLQRYRLDYHSAPVPFVGGAVGYFSYDLRHFIERLPIRAIDDLQLPECYLGFYDVVIAFDHLHNKTYIVSTGLPELTEHERLKRARRRLEEMKDRLTDMPSLTQKLGPVRQADIKSGFTHQGYVEAVEKARQYIIAGDIFEVNLSQRFDADLSIHPYELYQKLRQLNPAPFASYLSFDEVSIVSASPERFLRLQGDLVETRPIKGTRPRGRSPQEDRALARELLSSAKDKAENMMIVDLERNDLGRVCRFGTVKVTELAILETYPTVFHLTSTVVGRLRQDKNGIDLLKAAFPGGSITGAPKVRAMEIIDELEPTRRSVYTGAIGYIGFNGDLDLNIAIRTFIVQGNRAYFQVGGAVVYDSDPEAEYQETLHKGKALIDALNNATVQAANVVSHK